MSQQKLAELAGIERKQLSILENGGNVTLATIRKIVEHLPNMEPFTLGTAAGKAFPTLPQEAQMEAMKMMGTTLQTIFEPFLQGRIPNEEDTKALEAAARSFYRTMGLTDEEIRHDLDVIAAQQPQQPQPEKLTEEERAAAVSELAAQLDKAEEALEQLAREEEAEAAEAAAQEKAAQKEKDDEPPPAEKDPAVRAS